METKVTINKDIEIHIFIIRGVYIEIHTHTHTHILKPCLTSKVTIPVSLYRCRAPRRHPLKKPLKRKV